MRPSRTYLGPTRRLEIIKKQKELFGLLRFGPSKGILRHEIIKKHKELYRLLRCGSQNYNKNIRNYSVYCDVGHDITKKHMEL